MRLQRLKRRLVAVAALTLASSGLAFATATAAEAACSDITIIGARGSKQSISQSKLYAGSPQLGSWISNMKNGIEGRGLSVQLYELGYPATIVGELTNFDSYYYSSQWAGQEELRLALRNETRNCPRSRVVLVGYSQGAHVIGDVLEGKQGNPTRDRPNISKAEADKVRAAVLIGDPAYRAREWYAWGSAKGVRNGILYRNRGGLDYWRASNRVASYCVNGDFICSRTGGLVRNGIKNHSNFYQNARDYRDAATKYVLRQLGYSA